MDRISTRQLRNDVSRVLRRVRSGERLVVTSNGVPVAEIGPLERHHAEPTLEELIEAGLVNPPRSLAPPRPAEPISFSGSRTTEEILDELREDRL